MYTICHDEFFLCTGLNILTSGAVQAVVLVDNRHGYNNSLLILLPT
jgi:hypothetical protein